MASLETGLYELGQLDRLASQDTPVHRLDPRAKVLTTLVFLVCVVSFSKYSILGMVPFALFPIAMASEGRLPLRFLARKLVAVAPFAIFIGMFNPWLDRDVIMYLGDIGISGGWVSYASIIGRFLLTTSAALVLIGTTGMMGVCMAIERLGAPDVFATQLLFLYRYIFVLGEEAMRMSRARALRSFGSHGMGMHVYGQMLGQLLLRTYDRAQRVYLAMQCRGFDGHVRVMRTLRLTGRDVTFTLGWSAAFVLFRLYNVPLLVGHFVTGLIT
ncbi:MAG: cobalt ECF transporter T component CbiQ [Coriobacteriia bacterium]|nr:cobalt ECF transporter T component CbiQ [Coriobacteriia bacterium]MBN2821746.1 cobalt ECF transporter T component CbiQ [Coriobacteriia bacterium]